MLSKLIIYTSFILFCFTDSSDAQEIQSISVRNKNSDVEFQQSRLAVISLKITKIKDQYSVSFTNAGLFNTSKNIPELKKTWTENDFVCFIIDEQKQILDTLVIQQPMKIRYEFPQEDETIGTKIIDLPENEVLLRFPYTTEMKRLSITKCSEDGNLILIDTLDLPE